MPTPIPATPAAIRQAVDLLLAGELVAFPTETVYGLGANAGDPAAVGKIFAAKGRPADHPVIVHLAAQEHLPWWADDIPDVAWDLAEAFWPGPLTLILPRADDVADAITGGQDSVGVRLPSHPVARELLAAFAAAGGRGIAAPSANRFGRISPTSAEHVAEELTDCVAMILDGGACPVGIESTIVALTGERAQLLRPGGVSPRELERVLGYLPETASKAAPRASGTLASHYAPAKPAFLVTAAELDQVARNGNPAVLARRAAPVGFAGIWREAPLDAAHYARELYAHLRALDSAAGDRILIEAPPADLDWLAVNDRLRRATHR